MLYGNTARTNKIAWQFDKIYDSRYAMEFSLYSNSNIYGNDADAVHIAPGRFVLVSYGYEKDLNYGLYGEDGGVADNPYPVSTSDDYLYGYHNYYNQTETGRVSDNGLMYLDSTCTIPYRYTGYERVANPESLFINLYYIQRHGFYFKAPYWVDGEIYYTPTDANADTTTTITTGLVIHRRYNTISSGNNNPYPGGYSDEFYICIGPTNAINFNGNLIIGAAFSPITTIDARAGEKGTYLKNFAIDKEYYGDILHNPEWGTLNRGYDGTVWEKVVGEGEERYVLVAHLNAYTPSMTIVPEPPTDDPVAPFLGADSTEACYNLHVQSPWQYVLKSAGQNDLSDLADDDNNPYDFYYNKDGLDKHVHVLNESMLDQITVRGTGKSSNFDATYANSTIESNGDIKEISVHLPSIGNMVATGYDLIYGDGSEDTDFHTRKLDIEWYTPSDGPMISLGDTTNLQGKTHRLNTLAGTLNVMHDRLGLIVEEISTIPDSTTISASWDMEYLYHTSDNDKFYRKGTIYTKRDVSYRFYQCEQGEVTPYTWQPYTYYLLNEGANLVASVSDVVGILQVDETHTETHHFRGDEGLSFDPNATYYKRKVALADSYYSPIELTQYEQSKYYRKRGSDYYRDNTPNRPRDASLAYLQVEKSAPRQFVYVYRPNQFYIELTNGDYYTNTSPTPDPNVTYLSILSTPMTTAGNSGGYVYLPGIYYYYTDANHTLARLENASVPDQEKEYYYFVLSETPSAVTYIDDLGNVVNTLAYAVIETYHIAFDPDHNNIIWYSIDPLTGAYYKVTTEWLRRQSKEFFSQPQSFHQITSTEDVSNQIFVANKYYIEDLIRDDQGNEVANSGTGNLILATEEDFDARKKYYSITRTIPIAPFYVPNMYYFKTKKQDGETDAAYEARIPLLDSSANMRPSSEGQYYKKAGLYVYEDMLNECPYAYEWNAEAEVVPWIFTLKSRTENWGAIEIPGVNNGESSINGAILEIAKSTDMGNMDTRDENTLQGSLNSVKDKFYTLGNLIPGKILYTNSYGRVTSSNVTNAEIVALEEYDVPTLYKLFDGINHTAAGNDAQVLTGLTISTDRSHLYATDNTATISTTLSNVGGLKLTGYSVASGTPAAIAATDTINSAFGKLQRHINILTGNSSTQGSVAYQIAQIVNDNNNGSIDTLNEIAAWIINDNTGAAKMASDISDLQASMGTLEGASHSHSNKALLDTYTLTEVNLADAVTKRHSHANSAELDLIQSGDVSKWNAKQNAIAANTYDDYGAAADVESAITGTSSDTKADLTLNGLLAYIEELEQRIAALEPTPPPTPTTISFTIDDTPYTVDDGTTYGEEFTDLELTHVYLEGVEVWDDQDTYNSDSTLIAEGDAFTTEPPL